MKKLLYIISSLILVFFIGSCHSKDPCKHHDFNKIPLVPEKSPTCEEDGYKAFYYCDVCENVFDENKELASEEDIVLPKLGHDYEITYTFNNCQFTAKAICKNNNRHIITETVNSTYTIIKQATKEEDGLGRYTGDEFINPLFSVQTKDEVIKYETIASDHSFTHFEYLAPTCDEDGHLEYYYCSVCNNYIYEGHNLVPSLDDAIIPALGHSYEITYTLSEDKTTVTAKRICKNDSSHMDTETVNVTKSEDMSLLKIFYVSDNFTNDAFSVYTSSEDITVEALYISGYKNSFYLNEEFTKGNLRVIAKYSNGKELEITDYSLDYDIDITKANTYKITVKYKDKSTSYNVVYKESNTEVFPKA